MKEILFGFLAGIVTSLGMGGGAILVLLLGLFTNMDQHLIQGTNLIFFIPTSIISIIINIKNKIIHYKESIQIIISGIIGAFLGSILSIKIENQNLRKYFGYFLILIAIFEIFTLIREYKKSQNEK